MNKVLHIPTAQITIFTAINDSDKASHETRALLMCVCHSAVMSLTADETEALIHQSRLTTLERFRTGLEQSLAAANMMENPTLTALQVMGLFLVSRRLLGPPLSCRLPKCPFAPPN
jgi:hypothetical protein